MARPRPCEVIITRSSFELPRDESRVKVGDGVCGGEGLLMLTAVWGATDGQRMNDEWAALRDKSGKGMEMSVNLDGFTLCVHRA